MRIARTLCILANTLAAFVASPAAATNPGVPNSIVPAMIALVGLDAVGVPSPLGTFTVQVRDLANNPIPGALVRFEFTNVADASFRSDQPDPALTVNCGAHFVSKQADATGSVVFTLSGGATGTYSPNGTGTQGRFYVGDVLIGATEVKAFDIDGSGQVGSGDLSRFLEEFASGTGSWICDYDNSAYLGAADLSIWLAVYASGTQIQSPGALCP
jgi:hypothetical protein